MNSRLLSNRRNIRENLLMFFYSKEFLEDDCRITTDDALAFLDAVEEVKADDRHEGIRDSVKEVFDSVRITKLNPEDIIEFPVPFVTEKISMTFEEMDNENVRDAFLSKTVEIASAYGVESYTEKPADKKTPESRENLRFFTNYVNLYFSNLKYIDAEITKNLENWDFARISIIDKIILRMGIVELGFIEDIPPKVTINEAIELGKKYSTDKSNVFINGILNKLKDIHRESGVSKTDNQ